MDGMGAPDVGHGQSRVIAECSPAGEEEMRKQGIHWLVLLSAGPHVCPFVGERAKVQQLLVPGAMLSALNTLPHLI